MSNRWGIATEMVTLSFASMKTVRRCGSHDSAFDTEHFRYRRQRVIDNKEHNNMTLESKNLDAPDETRTFGHGSMGVVNVAGATIGRAVFNPGWKWSNDVKPIAGTDSCQAAHTGYVVSGRMRIVMDDGSASEVGPGDAVVISPGHDAWIVGDEPCVMLDWSGSANYAKPGG